MSSLRVLAANLAARSDSSLRSLLAARPDLLAPPVPDFAALAARSCSRASLSKALDRLDLPHLQLVEALLLTTNEDLGRPATAAQLKTVIPGSTQAILARLLKDLEAQALAYRDADSSAARSTAGFYPVASLREVIGAHPAGLGRSYPELVRAVPAAGAALLDATATLAAEGAPLRQAATPAEAALALADWLATAGSLPALLAGAPEQARAMLAKLAAHPLGTVPGGVPGGRTATHPTGVADPVRWLREHGLVVAVSDSLVELPSPVGLALRAGAIITDFKADPAAASPAAVSPAVVRNAALSATSELLRNLAQLVDAVAMEPLGTLRAGGVGVREVRRIADALGCGSERAAFLLELSAAAGLLELDVDTSRWRVSRARAAPLLALPRQEQWLALVAAWLSANRTPSVIGQPAARGAGSINALAAEVHRTDAPELRAMALQALLALSESGKETPGAAAGRDGAVRVPAPTAEEVLERVRWHRPRSVRRLRRLLPAFLAEAAALGILGSGALSPAGLLWCQGNAPGAAAVLAEELPPAVSHVLLQADLTAVAPGFLDPLVAGELRLLAEVEGQGPATVFRFSAAGIRRALDAGRTGEGILDFLARHCATGIPQPLEYLVRDTAARHGALRLGASGSYLVADDPDVLAPMLELPALEPLGLRLLAPTVLVAAAAPAELSAALAGLGLHPAADVVFLEAHAGATNPGKGSSANTAAQAVGMSAAEGPSVTLPVPAAVPAPGAAPPAAEEAIAAQLSVLRSKPTWGPAGAEAGTQLGLESLHRAIRLKEKVRLTLVDGSGNQERLQLVPLSLHGGRVRVFDPQRGTERVVSIHRVMEVEPL